MSTNVIQKAFHTGEWAPQLNARVDLAKYHTGAALLKNWVVNYHGGADTRMGTKYVLQALKPATVVRLIPFQASTNVGYILEFGDFYIRFHYRGGTILESSSFGITGATQANPCVLTIPGHTFVVGDWIYAQSVGGMVQLNNKFYRVKAIVGAAVSLSKVLDVTNVNSTAYGAYTAGGTATRVYTLATPYAATDLALLKFAQNIDTMILCHPNYVPSALRIISSANWSLTPIAFGTSAATPGGIGSTTTLGAGNVNYAYVVTSVDYNGQESGPSTATVQANKLDLRTTAGTTSITWTAVTGAAQYNVYKAELSYSGAVPAGAAYGYIGFCTGVQFDDSNIPPDFSLTPPVTRNPFSGASVASVTVTVPGAYTVSPTVSFAAAPPGGVTATGTVFLAVTARAIAAVGLGYAAGEVVYMSDGSVLQIATVSGSGQVLTYTIISSPYVTGAVTANPITQIPPYAGFGAGFQINDTWGVGFISLNNVGSGYLAAPAITFSAGAGAATAVLGPASAGNPSVPALFQQRLVLAAQQNNLQGFNISQPGSYYNYNISQPIQEDDAISGVLVAGQLNEIKSMISMPSGLILLTNKAAWQINGGSPGSAISPSALVASPNSYIGGNDVPPLVANDHILHVQAKGSVVRDLIYNFGANIYTGTDVTIMSTHLFAGYNINEWCWAEEPARIVWAVRNSGELLSMAYMKEQEVIGWSHHDTAGQFTSIATVAEPASFGPTYVDAVYVVAQRTINGNLVKFIERMVDRVPFSTNDRIWCVDAGLQYNGAPTASFSGGDHLVAATVTGLADGVVIPPFVMPASGNFVLGSAASIVTVGLAYTPDLQTLALEVGEPTVQGKRKKIAAVTVRCQETLGLSIGRSFSTLVPMKDLIVGNVGSCTNTPVTGLVTGDARTNIDPLWDEQGQFCLRQPYPFPASVLGVIPEIVIGDTVK